MLKSKKLYRSSKRLMSTYSFCKFKESLLWKSKQRNVNCYIVDESYTLKTCSNCGWINYTLGGNKIYNCKMCNIVIDRDLNADRNILIKNLQC
jgi:transposase